MENKNKKIEYVIRSEILLWTAIALRTFGSWWDNWMMWWAQR